MIPKYNEGDIVKTTKTGEDPQTIEKVYTYDTGICYALVDYDFLVKESDITELVEE